MTEKKKETATETLRAYPSTKKKVRKEAFDRGVPVAVILKEWSERK